MADKQLRPESSEGLRPRMVIVSQKSGIIIIIVVVVSLLHACDRILTGSAWWRGGGSGDHEIALRRAHMCVPKGCSVLHWGRTTHSLFSFCLFGLHTHARLHS